MKTIRAFMKEFVMLIMTTVLGLSTWLLADKLDGIDSRIEANTNARVRESEITRKSMDDFRMQLKDVTWRVTILEKE